MNVASLEDIIDEFPSQIQLPIKHLVDWIQTDRSVTREDFSELKQAIRDLAVSQARTEDKVQQLTDVQKKTDKRIERLTKAQEKTEKRVQGLTEVQERLAEAQEKTEKRVQGLAEAQEKTEKRVQELAEAQEKTEKRVQNLAEAQEKTEKTMEIGFKSLSNQITALGSRWGIYNEGTFRSTIRGLFGDMEGIRVEQGEYGDRQVDVIIRNGEHVMLEITSRMHSKDIDKLYRSADDYLDRTGVSPKLMVATSYVAPRLMEKIMGLERKIEIFSYDPEGE